MTNPIDRRLDRLETELQKRTDPGRGPIFTLIDDPRDPENGKRLQEAAQFKRDNPALRLWCPCGTCTRLWRDIVNSVLRSGLTATARDTATLNGEPYQFI